MKIINLVLIGLIIGSILMVMFNPGLIGFGRHSYMPMHRMGMAWLWVVAILAVVYIQFPSPKVDEKTIVRRRFAKGEIDNHEYKHLMKTLDEERNNEKY